MKSQVRSVLFALVGMAACGGDREAPAPTAPPVASPSTGEVVTPAKAAFGDMPTAKPAPAPVGLPAGYAEALELGTSLVATDHARARELLEHAAKLDKKQAAPHIELARLFIASNERALAIRAANKAVKLAPESSVAYNTLGRAELLRFNYDAAILAFRQATELDADNIWAWNNLGLTQLQLKHYQEAADALAEATTRKGTTGYMWNNLGIAYEHLDQLDDAREAYEAGGALGSREALASRNRLEGVDTIVVMADSAETKTGPEADEHSYESHEELPEDVAPVDDMKLDVEVEDVEVESPVVEPPVVDEPDDEPVAPASETPDAGVSPI